MSWLRMVAAAVACILLVVMGWPRAARAGPKFDCGHGVGVIFCPLRIPAFVIQARLDFAEAVMNHGETVALGMLEGVNFYGQLIGEMGDRIVTTEALVVDVAEDLIPGVIVARAVGKGIVNLTAHGNGGDLLPTAILDTNSLVVRQQSTQRAQPPDLLGKRRKTR